MEWRDVPGDDADAASRPVESPFVAANIEPAMHAVHRQTGFSYEIINLMPRMALDRRTTNWSQW